MTSGEFTSWGDWGIGHRKEKREKQDHVSQTGNEGEKQMSDSEKLSKCIDALEFIAFKNHPVWT